MAETFGSRGSLDRLSGDPQPCILWDFERQSVVGANQAALQFFAAESVESLASPFVLPLSRTDRQRLADYQTRLIGGQAGEIRDLWSLPTRAGRRIARTNAVRWPAPNGAAVMLLRLEGDASDLGPDLVRTLDLFRQLPLLVSCYDAQGALLLRNPSAAEVLAEHGMTLFQALHDRGLAAEVRDVLREGEFWTGDARVVTAHGLRWHCLAAHRIVDPVTGRASTLVAEYDVTKRVCAEEALRRRERHERRSLALLRCAGEVLFECDGEGHWTYLNEAWRRFSGYAPDETVGRPVEEFVAAEDRDRLRDLLAADVPTPEVPLRWTTADGGVVWGALRLAPAASSEHPATRVGALADASEPRRFEDRIRDLTYRDQLTGLPNRRHAMDHLQELVDQRSQDRGPLTVMLLDLDNFRDVNDSFGHRFGDRALQAVAARLVGAVDGAYLARFGGDEFLVVRSGEPAGDGAGWAAELLRNLDRPIEFDGRTLFITATIGMAVYPRDGLLSEDLFRRADVALRAAKGEGRSRALFFRTETDRWLLDLKVTEDQIRRALETDQLVLHYQPQVNLATGRIQELEALIRWDHPERGLLPPSHFLPHASVTGLIRKIGEWALLAASRQLMAWRARGLTDIRVAGNLSDTEFRDGDILAVIDGALQASGLPPHQLELELSETTIIAGREAYVAESLRKLRAKGITIALDDFGIGYSSLLYLSRLPVNKLKIDRSFIEEVDSSPVQAAIVRNTIRLAKDLDLLVAAEGVERPEQLEFLRSTGCHLAQGFYFYRPLRAEEIWAVLEKERGLS